MHRCLFSYALPAEIRCLSARFLTQRQPPQPRWLPQWRSYSTETAEKRQAESSWIDSPYASRFLEDSPTPSHQEHVSDGGTQDDAYDFILEGYAAEPSVRQTRRARMKEQPVAVRRTPSRIPVQAGPSRKQREKRMQGFDDFRRKTRRQARTHTRLIASRPRKHTWDRLPQMWGRPKYVSFQTHGDTSDKFSHSWNMNFARVRNQTDVSLRGSQIGKSAPLLDTRTARWVEAISKRQALGQPLDLEGLAHESQIRKSAIWSNITLWLLYYDRGSLFDFLRSTSGDPQIPAGWVADSLHLCLMHLTTLRGADRKERTQQSIEILQHFAERLNFDNVILAGSSLVQLLKLCSGEQMVAVYQAIRTSNFRLHHNTYLHFASALAKNDHFHQGLDALLQARHSAGQAFTRSRQFRSACATLLRRSVALPGGMRVVLRIVDNLVNIGVALTTRLCNVLILNAVDSGDLHTAHAIYRSLVNHEVKADKYTYAILLKGCKQTLDDSDTLNRTIKDAIAGTKIMENPILATEILHCLALHHAHAHTSSQTDDLGATEQAAVFQKAWTTIYQAYAQLFSTTPLEQLGLPTPTAVKTTPKANKPMPATAQSVGIMLQTYSQLAYYGQRTPNRIYGMYQRYKSLVEAREPLFVELARADYCANAFLWAFTKSERELVNAAAVIKDMQQSIVDDPVLGCAPTVRSYSIFLHGFTRFGKMELAEQVLTFMRSKGIEPNEVTWNTLLGGYAGQQDVEGLLDASRRFEAGGGVWDEYTYHGVRRLRDVRKYREAVEGRQSSPKLDFTDELKARLGDRISAEQDDGAWEDQAQIGETDAGGDGVNGLLARRKAMPDQQASQEDESEGMKALRKFSEAQSRS